MSLNLIAASILAAGAAVIIQSAAPLNPEPTNLDFDQGTLSNGWSSSPAGAGYRIEANETAARDGDRGGLLAFDGRPESQDVRARLTQSIDAAPYRGRRVRLSGWAKIVRPSPFAGLWLRVDRPNGAMGFFDNMSQTPIVARDWTRYEIVGEVAVDAERISFGAHFVGGGEVHVDDFAIEDVEALGPPSAEAAAYLDRALDILENQHINSGKMDWPALRGEANALLLGARSPSGAHAAIQHVIRALGEKHTMLLPPERPADAAPRATTPSSPAVADAKPLPTGEMVAGYGLVRLPRLVTRTPADMAHAQTYATTLQTLLQSFDDAGACGWIVDLRGNGGGNMWPMLAGLSGLLDQGPFGAFVKGEDRTPWRRIDGHITASASPRETEPAVAAELKYAKRPIAVLIGPRTASSGEMTAIAFVGQSNVRLFGQPSANFTTANIPVPLSDGATLLVTSSGVADRTGRFYDGPIVPDETTELEAAQSAAIAWLDGQECPAR